MFGNPDGGIHGIKPGLLKLVRDYNIVNSVTLRAACATESAFHPRLALKLECNMFDHMTDPRTFPHSFKESSRIVFRATVTVHSREQLFYAIGKPVDPVCRIIFHFSDVQL